MLVSLRQLLWYGIPCRLNLKEKEEKEEKRKILQGIIDGKIVLRLIYTHQD